MWKERRASFSRRGSIERPRHGRTSTRAYVRFWVSTVGCVPEVVEPNHPQSNRGVDSNKCRAATNRRESEPVSPLLPCGLFIPAARFGSIDRFGSTDESPGSRIQTGPRRVSVESKAATARREERCGCGALAVLTKPPARPPLQHFGLCDTHARRERGGRLLRDRRARGRQAGLCGALLVAGSRIFSRIPLRVVEAPHGVFGPSHACV